MARAFFPVIVVVFLIRSFWVEPFKIPSGSMKPTLLVGDFILVNKYTYGIRIPVMNKKVIEVNPIRARRRGGVPLSRAIPRVDYIKRVVGTPGDKVVYRGKRLTVNGEAVAVQRTRLLHRRGAQLPAPAHLHREARRQEPPDDDRPGAAAGGSRAGRGSSPTARIANTMTTVSAARYPRATTS